MFRYLLLVLVPFPSSLFPRLLCSSFRRSFILMVLFSVLSLPLPSITVCSSPLSCVFLLCTSFSHLTGFHFDSPLIHVGDTVKMSIPSQAGVLYARVKAALSIDTTRNRSERTARRPWLLLQPYIPAPFAREAPRSRPLLLRHASVTSFSFPWTGPIIRPVSLLSLISMQTVAILTDTLY